MRSVRASPLRFFEQPENKVSQIEHLTFGGQRSKLGSVLLPILAIKGYHNNFSNRSRFQAAHIDTVTVGIGSRNVEGFNPAHLAKQMFGDTGVESVG